MMRLQVERSKPVLADQAAMENCVTYGTSSS